VIVSIQRDHSVGRPRGMLDGFWNAAKVLVRIDQNSHSISGPRTGSRGLWRHRQEAGCRESSRPILHFQVVRVRAAPGRPESVLAPIAEQRRIL